MKEQVQSSQLIRIYVGDKIYTNSIAKVQASISDNHELNFYLWNYEVIKNNEYYE